MLNDIVIVFGLQEHQPINDDVDSIAEQNKLYDNARRLIFSSISSKGGRIVGQIHGNEIVTIPIDQSEVIKEIHKRLIDELGFPCSIGVGENVEQAVEALDCAIEKMPNTIKVYSSEMNQESTETSEDIHKSENYAPVFNEDRVKIAQILQSLQQNKDLFDQIAQQSPDIYAGIVSVVQSLTAMLQEYKEAKQSHIKDLINKINRHLSNHHKKQTKKYTKEIQKELDSHYKDKEEENREKFLEWWMKQKHVRKARRDMIKQNPDNQLLFDLVRNKIK